MTKTDTTETVETQYRIEGKTLVWTPEPWEGEDPLPDVRLPLRVKAKALDGFKVPDNPDVSDILNLFNALFPSQTKTLMELDVMEVGELFGAWTQAFQNRNGASLGGILSLARFIAEHRGPLEYDWRTRFGQPLGEVGGKHLGWSEAKRLMQTLTTDTSTQLFASIANWEYPISLEARIMADLIDLQAAAKMKKPRPYPRPWNTKAGAAKRLSNKAGRTPAQVLQTLEKMKRGDLS